MRCERAQELISAHVDGELDAGDASAVAAHVETCPHCRETAADIRQIGGAMARLGREPAPPELLARVRSGLAGIAGQREGRRPSLAFGVVRQAAALAAACVLSALATWWVMHAAARTERLEEQLLAAHVRSLIQDSPIQVASSDSHTVKPWFAGRVDFAPEVKDLTADGFPLLGGRLDYVDERRVGVLVYRRRLHVINVFMWPATSAEASGPLLHRKNGYNILSWSRGGVGYWAVSDVEPGELRRLQELL
jgi:anti-sigma factor RsiW